MSDVVSPLPLLSLAILKRFITYCALGWGQDLLLLLKIYQFLNSLAFLQISTSVDCDSSKHLHENNWQDLHVFHGNRQVWGMTG